MTAKKKPKFGIIEQLKALELPPRWYEFKVSRLPYLVRLTRMNIYQKLLDEKIPHRNPGSSINWDNYFAVQMFLDQPIKRKDIFPDGTLGMSDDEILNQAHDYLEPLSVEFNFHPITTSYDPVEFPEVIDEDHRAVSASLNRTAFLRTMMGCSGHGEDERGGYDHSMISNTIDCKNAYSDIFVKDIENLCSHFSKENINASCEYIKENDLGTINIRLNIDTPANWQGEDYPHSDECKAIRDEFWEEVRKIADKYAAQ